MHGSRTDWEIGIWRSKYHVIEGVFPIPLPLTPPKRASITLRNPMKILYIFKFQTLCVMHKFYNGIVHIGKKLMRLKD